MAVKCAHCNGTDVIYGFDTYQCCECSGHTKMDGTATVPTSALEVNGSFDGPGKELIEAPGIKPNRARDWER